MLSKATKIEQVQHICTAKAVNFFELLTVIDVTEEEPDCNQKKIWYSDQYRVCLWKGENQTVHMRSLKFWKVKISAKPTNEKVNAHLKPIAAIPSLASLNVIFKKILEIELQWNPIFS